MRLALLSSLFVVTAAPAALAQGSLERAHGRLVVDVTGDDDGVRVTVDGLVLPKHRWGVPTRVELGEHLVEAVRDGEVVSSSTAVVVRGGDAYVELEVAAPRAAEGPLRIAPASRPSALGDPGDDDGSDSHRAPLTEEAHADEGADSDEGDARDGTAYAAVGDDPPPDDDRPSSDDGGASIPTWVWWGAGGLAAVVLVVVVVAVAAGGRRPVEGDLTPGVLRF